MVATQEQTHINAIMLYGAGGGRPAEGGGGGGGGEKRHYTNWYTYRKYLAISLERACSTA